MGLAYRFVPLTLWPQAETEARRRAQFRSTFADTCDLLDRELRHLAAENIVIQAFVEPHQVRLDGMLRSEARPNKPGIVLAFDSKHGPLSYPCDRYLDWKDNLRAIALSLEALRSVDRYGVTQRAEQYKGWAQLPPPQTDRPFASAAKAATHLAHLVGGSMTEILTSAEAAQTAYRRAATKLHPDAGGNQAEFALLGEAWEVVRRHHGIA